MCGCCPGDIVEAGRPTLLGVWLRGQALPRKCVFSGRSGGYCPGQYQLLGASVVEMQDWIILPHACVQVVKKDAAEGGGANEE